MILKTSERYTFAKSGCGDQSQQVVSQAHRLFTGQGQKIDACDGIIRRYVFGGKVRRRDNDEGALGS
jgi:hypothetical protein